jgi:hypothetical protein
MTVLRLADQKPFTTKDGSTIRSILDRTNAPVEKQSLAEAQVPAGTATQRHYHRLAEEFYFIVAGRGEMEIDGETRTPSPRVKRCAFSAAARRRMPTRIPTLRERRHGGNRLADRGPAPILVAC